MKFLYWLARPKWIVDEEGELGLRVFGMNLYYYKHPEPLLDNQTPWRVINKREFGEVIRKQR